MNQKIWLKQGIIHENVNTFFREALQLNAFFKSETLRRYEQKAFDHIVSMQNGQSNLFFIGRFLEVEKEFWSNGHRKFFNAKCLVNE